MLSESNNMERLSLKSVAYKSWITPKGKVINLNNDAALYGDYHHVHKVVDSPRLFGITSKELQELDPEKYPYLVQNNKLGYRKENWSTPILRELGKRGYIRVANHSFQAGPEMVHSFELSNHGYEGEHHIQTFLPALRKVRDTIAKTQISKKDPISVKLFGIDGVKDRFTQHFESLAHIDEVLTKLETTDKPRRSSDPLPVVPRHFSSAQTRQLLGRTPPEGIDVPQAIWNNMRTLGDSYIPLMTFKQFIIEQTEIRRLKPTWELREKTPQSVYGGKDRVDGYMLKRIEAWHNPPTEMDVGKINSWARDLGFIGIEKVGNEHAITFSDRTGKKQIASKIQLPGKKTKFFDALNGGSIQPNSTVMRSQISNAYTDKNRNDILPWVVSELHNASVFHGHVPSNVHKYGMSPDELQSEKTQSQKIMTAWANVTHKDATKEHSDAFYDLANEPETRIRHAASLWTNIHLLHKRLSQTFHPFTERNFSEKGPTPFNYMLLPYAAVQKAHTKFMNHFNKILESAKAVDVSVPDQIHRLKEIADDNLAHAETFSGSERNINSTISSMMRQNSLEVPSTVQDPKVREYLEKMKSKVSTQR